MFPPVRSSSGSCGVDLFCPVDRSLFPGQRTVIDLLVRATFPPGYFGLLALRSSVARDTRLSIRGGIIGERLIRNDL